MPEAPEPAEARRRVNPVAPAWNWNIRIRVFSQRDISVFHLPQQRLSSVSLSPGQRTFRRHRSRNIMPTRCRTASTSQSPACPPATSRITRAVRISSLDAVPMRDASSQSVHYGQSVRRCGGATNPSSRSTKGVRGLQFREGCSMTSKRPRLRCC